MPRSARTGLPALLLLIAAAGYLAAADPARWAPVPVRSLVVFEARHALGNFAGRSEEITGHVVTDPADLKAGATGALTVSVHSLRTGRRGRDRDMRGALGAPQYRDIRYVVEGVEASFGSLSDRSDVTLTIRGVMSIRGADRPVSFTGRARLRDERLWVRGESTVRLADFGIVPPRRLFLAVSDEIAVRFDLLLERTSP